MAAPPARDVCFLRLAGAGRGSDAEHDDFSDGDALDEQEGAISAENAQPAFDLTPPVKWQYAGDGFDKLKVLVRGCRQDRGIPPPGRDDNEESADERSALESTAAGRFANEHHVSVHGWSTAGRHASVRLPRTARSYLDRVANAAS